MRIPLNYEKQSLPSFDKWVDALEGGDIKQTRKMLLNQSTGGMCCLGVLSLVQGLLQGNRDCGVNDEFLSYNNPCRSILSKDGRFPSGVKVFYKGNNKESLAAMNDAGATFKTIAKIIRELWTR